MGKKFRTEAPDLLREVHWSSSSGPRLPIVCFADPAPCSKRAPLLDGYAAMRLLERFPTDPTSRADGFCFSAAMHTLIGDIVEHVSELAHIRPEQVLVGVTRARNQRPGGLYARIVPMRFAGGCLTTQRRGQVWHMQRFWLDECEILYLLHFFLPRYGHLDFEEKLVTVFHELYHISPEFNGDLRRWDGPCVLHGRSIMAYDRRMLGLARDYVRLTGGAPAAWFLRLSWAQLCAAGGTVWGYCPPLPKLLPCQAGVDRPGLSGTR
ncbi:MAG: hypothetical protein C4297_04425 [Gemmataceae bacterium]